MELQEAGSGSGYDVVILDFPNLYGLITVGPYNYQVVTRHSGADYMERNAYTLVTLIQQLNQQMQAANPGTTEKIVVVGPSMGGQIARYALAYMEHNILPHNTRLYVSLDSPNNGATIPIGLQHFVSFFAGETGKQELQDGLGLLNSPASRELTLQHHSQDPGFPARFGVTPYQSDPLRTNFVNSLNALGGYPSQLRRVAVTDGALDATPQHDQNGQVIHANDQAFLLEQRGVPRGTGVGAFVRFLFPIGLVGRLITTAKARVYYGAGYGQGPSGPVATVLDAYTITGGSVRQYAVGVPNSCSLDAAAGGYRKFLGFAGDGPTGFFNNVFSKTNFYSVHDQSCFIPTLSALGPTQPVDNCQPAGQNLVCAGATPFDAYYGPVGRNYEHLQLTPENVAFMRDEILQLTPLPVFTAAPTAICPGGTGSFRVKAECARAGQPGTAYTWTASSGLTIASGQGTATVTVQATAGFTGGASVSVVGTRVGGNASAAVSVPVFINWGSVGISAPESPKCFTEDFNYTWGGLLTQGVVEWHVYLNGTLRDELIVRSHDDQLLVWPNEGGTMMVTATIGSQCSGQYMTASTNTTVIEFFQGDPDYQLCPARQNRPAPRSGPPPTPTPPMPC